jgi:AcrR family transcriptional regulator
MCTLSTLGLAVYTVNMSPPYHHGNVPEALIEETLHLIDVDGLEAFSLRRAAAAVGVSPMAAYRHFPGRDGLLRSAAATALDELGAELEAELLGQ